MKKQSSRLVGLFAGSLLSLGLAAGVQAKDTATTPEKAMVIVSSGSLQTQGMAMVLSQAMQAQGVALDILLCDKAGDLAVSSYESESALAPKGMKPEGLMQMMMGKGAKVAVCALYLPNSNYKETDLREGVTVAQPPVMAEMMRSAGVKVFEF